MKRAVHACEAETDVKRSRFIAYLVPLGEFDGMQSHLKAEHPKASHVVYAWRHINKYDQMEERFDDDGEPRGCAGQPILNVLRGAELVETALLVVRYFGGIKLGTGGMVRAYSAAARAVVTRATTERWQRHERLSFRSDYSAQRQIFYLLEQLGIRCPAPRFDPEGIVWEIEAPAELLARFRERAGRLLSR